MTIYKIRASKVFLKRNARVQKKIQTFSRGVIRS